tara:strand:+ start:2314 stop:2472 length:159 start_codon:yes stop_codon:yes gene_type:complete
MLHQKPSDIIYSTFKSYNNHLKERLAAPLDKMIGKITQTKILIQSDFIVILD